MLITDVTASDVERFGGPVRAVVEVDPAEERGSVLVFFRASSRAAR